LPSILINGCEATGISVLDRGFQYGDGLFETLRIRSGQPRHWSRHLARLQLGCERLHIARPDVTLLRAEADRLCAGIDDGVLKLTVTRGEGGRGYAVRGKPTPSRVLAVFAAPEFPAAHASEGVRLRVCDTRLGCNPALAGIKHLNRLEQVLARAEWQDETIAEGLMLDSENRIIEGTMSNIFCVRDGALYTPVLSRCGVRGVTRDRVMELAGQMGLTAHEQDMGLADLAQAEEMFITNTLISLWPVRQLEDRHYAVGPVATRLRQALEAADA
jgi:4-amino-4-deoxychorismate lyase